MMKYYVDAKAVSFGDGSEKHPFRTIQQAADRALPGDEVIVMPGIYREQVRPVHAGRKDAPVVYRSAEPLDGITIVPMLPATATFSHPRRTAIPASPAPRLSSTPLLTAA